MINYLAVACLILMVGCLIASITIATNKTDPEQGVIPYGSYAVIASICLPIVLFAWSCEEPTVVIEQEQCLEQYQTVTETTLPDLDMGNGLVPTTLE